jgi:hypothetical protein
MKFKEILEKKRALAGLSESGLPVKIKVAIAKNILRMEEEEKIFNRERIAIIRKYALKDENGKELTREDGTYEFGENESEAVREINELLSCDSDFEIKKISEEDLESLSVMQIAQLDWMIDYEDM